VTPVERESSVERLASLVYGLLMAYIWFWILVGAVMVVGLVVKLVFLAAPGVAATAPKRAPMPMPS
jgi:hypothetical protein